MKYVRSFINKLSQLKTKTIIVIALSFLGAGGLGVAVPLATHADPTVTCTQTGFYRDSIDMTAAAINPTHTVTGNIDATGCNIGVYFGPGTHGSVDQATVHGANYYGIVVQKAKVNVENSDVYQIGDQPFTGDQHGVGIYYATIAGVTNGDCTTGSTSGEVENTSVSTYQKAGIVVDCTGSNVNVSNNVVQGLGPVNFIAQNGIEIGLGANSNVTGNIVTDNSYTGSGEASSGGILVYGGTVYGGAYTTGTQVNNNTVIGNDVGIYASNLASCGDTSCLPATTRTNIDISNNTIANAGLNNMTGNSATQGYQAGISDQGDRDTIANNNISGAGYNPANSSPSIAVFAIDITSTNNVRIHDHRFH